MRRRTARRINAAIRARYRFRRNAAMNSCFHQRYAVPSSARLASFGPGRNHGWISIYGARFRVTPATSVTAAGHSSRKAHVWMTGHAIVLLASTALIGLECTRAYLRPQVPVLPLLRGRRFAGFGWQRQDSICSSRAASRDWLTSSKRPQQTRNLDAPDQGQTQVNRIAQAQR